MTLVIKAQDGPYFGPKVQFTDGHLKYQLPIAFDCLPYDQITLSVFLEVYQNSVKGVA